MFKKIRDNLPWRKTTGRKPMKKIVLGIMLLRLLSSSSVSN